MNVSKLRTFGILWGADKGREDKLRIHGEKWTEVLIDINHDGFMTHLGVIWNMDTNNLKQVEYLNERLEEMGSRILRHRGRVGDKILALEYCLRADIVYRMQFCVLGLEAYEKLNKTYTRLVKKITRNLAGFPAIPLWTLTRDGGLGLQSLLDFTHKLKLRLLLRNVESDDDTGRALQGLLARALRNGGNGGVRACNQPIRSSLVKPTWLTSLIDWLAKTGLTIEVQGPKPRDVNSEFLIGNETERKLWFERGLALVGENTDDVELLPIAFRTGQCWELDGKVNEIVAFDGDTAQCLVWEPDNEILYPGVSLCVSPENDYKAYANGMGTGFSLPLSRLETSTMLIERNKDGFAPVSSDPLCLNQKLVSTISHIRNRRPVRHSHVNPAPNPASLLNTYFMEAYTDGSWKTEHTVSSFLLGCGKPTTAGAIVLKTLRGMLTIKVNMDIEVKGAFESEVVSLLIAHELSNGRSTTIWSDCEAAIKALTGDKKGALDQVIAGWKKKQNIKFKKVLAHPERRKKESNWTDQEKGNFLADQIAGGMVEPMLTVNASDWLLRIGASSKIIITTTEGTPCIGDIRAVKSKGDTLRYLKDRDKYRAKDNKPSLWEGANFSLHHKLMGHNTKIGDRVITQRIGLLKRWQWLSARTNNTCQGCLQVVSDISHPIKHCLCVEAIAARDKLWKDVETAVMRSPRKHHPFLFDIVNQIRTKTKGEIACCGTFVPEFVNQLTAAGDPLEDDRAKVLTKVLRTIALGTRTLLRVSAEIQLGPIGINWRQTSIKEHFKFAAPSKRLQTPYNVVVPSNDRIARIIVEPRNTEKRISNRSRKNNKNNNECDYDIDFKQNKTLNIFDIFDSKPQVDGIYWELKAG